MSLAQETEKEEGGGEQPRQAWKPILKPLQLKLWHLNSRRLNWGFRLLK